MKKLCCLTVLLCGVSGQVLAEVAVKSESELIMPAADTRIVSEQVKVMRDSRKLGGYALRCWHHGRLIYDGTGFKGETDKAANVIHVPRLDGEVVSVMDLRDGVCMLSKAND